MQHYRYFLRSHTTHTALSEHRYLPDWEQQYECSPCLLFPSRTLHISCYFFQNHIIPQLAQRV